METEMILSRSIKAEAALACGFVLAAVVLAAPNVAAEASRAATPGHHVAAPTRFIDPRATAQAPGTEPLFSPPFFGDLKRGVLSVHASQTISGYWLPRHLVAFRRSHPGVAIRLSMGNTSEAAAAVRAGEADLGFVEGEVDDPILVSEPVARDQLVIVVGGGHPWAEAKSLGAEDLLNADWVLREPGSGTRSNFEHALEALGVSPHNLRIALELPSNEAVRAAVEAGMGAAVISGWSPRRASRRGSFIRPPSRFRNAASTRCVTPNDIGAGPPMRSWTS